LKKLLSNTDVAQQDHEAQKGQPDRAETEAAKKATKATLGQLALKETQVIPEQQVKTELELFSKLSSLTPT
jgi:hypothetical protein